MDQSATYLRPEILARIDELELTATKAIEGLVSGVHRSPLQGVSVEFAEHRQYTAGDDPRHIDWKLYAKTDRVFLKRYEQETNLVCHLVIDASQSMAYASAGRSKLRHAAELAASLAHLIVNHQDGVGMTFFEDKVRYFVPPSSQPAQLKQLLHLLAVCQPSNLDSDLGAAFDEVAERLHQRSMVFVISDGFDRLDRILRGLEHLRFKRHEIVFFHVLDRAELEFPFRDMTLFKGLERQPELLADPRGLRKAYLEAFGKYRRELEHGCQGTDVDYQLAVSDQPLGDFLAKWLMDRAARGKR